MKYRIVSCLLMMLFVNLEAKNSSTEGHKNVKNSSVHRAQSFAHDIAARFSTIFESIISRVRSVSKQATIAADTIIQTSGPVAQDYVTATAPTVTPPVTSGLLTIDAKLTIAANGNITLSNEFSTVVSGGTVTISTPGSISGFPVVPNLILNPLTGTEVIIDGSLNLSGSINNYFIASRLVHITGDATFDGNNSFRVIFNSDVTVDGTLNIINNTISQEVEGVTIAAGVRIQADTIVFNNNRGGLGVAVGDNGGAGIILNDTSIVTATNSITFSNNIGGAGQDGEPFIPGGNGGDGVFPRGTLTAPSIYFNNNAGGNGGVGDPNGVDGYGVYVSSAAAINGTVFIVQNCTGGANQEFYNNGGTITPAISLSNITNTGGLCNNTL